MNTKAFHSKNILLFSFLGTKYHLIFKRVVGWLIVHLLKILFCLSCFSRRLRRRRGNLITRKIFSLFEQNKKLGKVFDKGSFCFADFFSCNLWWILPVFSWVNVPVFISSTFPMLLAIKDEQSFNIQLIIARGKTERTKELFRRLRTELRC